LDNPNTPGTGFGNEEHGFYPFATQAEFEFAELLYIEDEMSAPNIDDLIRILTAHYGVDKEPPGDSHDDLDGMYVTL
jgi:hypothetical protein